MHIMFLLFGIAVVGCLWTDYTIGGDKSDKSYAGWLSTVLGVVFISCVTWVIIGLCCDSNYTFTEHEILRSECGKYQYSIIGEETDAKFVNVTEILNGAEAPKDIKLIQRIQGNSTGINWGWSTPRYYLEGHEDRD